MINCIFSISDVLYIDGVRQDITLHTFLNELTLKNGKSIQTLRKSVKKYLGIYRSIPLFINSRILLVPIPLKNKDVFYFNYLALKDYIINENELVLIFLDNFIQKIKISRYRSNNIIKNMLKVYDYWK